MKKFSILLVSLFLLISCSHKTNYLNLLFEDWIHVEEDALSTDSYKNTKAYQKFVSDFTQMCDSDEFTNYRSIYFDTYENFFINYVSAIQEGIETENPDKIRNAIIEFELISKNQNSKASKYYLNIIIILAVFIFLVILCLFLIMQKYDRELDNAEQLGVYAAFVMETVEKERRRISKDIHDTALQDIRLIQLEVESLSKESSSADFEKTKSSIIDLSKKSIENLRSTCQNLTPTELKNVTDENALITAIHNLCQKFQEQYNIPCELSIQDNLVVEEINIKKSMQIFRIVQESLNNIQKHAEASYVSVVLKNDEADKDKNHLVIYITDDGKGFDVAKSQNRKHFGLLNMKERAKMIGANLSIESDSDAGTEIKLVI